MRVALAVCMAALIIAAGNQFLNWGLFGDSGKAVMSVVTVVAAIVLYSVLPKLGSEMQTEHEAELEKEREWERTRDKSNDQAETERLRAAIGMPPNKSLERTRE
jgi:hypothetical protein